MTRQGGFLIDLHCHTRERSFDGRIPAVELLRGVLAHGLSGVTFTDHNTPWPAEELDRLRQEVPLPADFFLAAGQEVRTVRHGVTWGDLLVFGLDEPVADGADPILLWERAHAAGGFVLAAHPGARGHGMGEHLGDLPILAAEVWNGRYGERVARESEALAERFGMIPFGGSDAHKPEDIGGGATWFPRMPESMADIGAMLRSGECRPWRPTFLERVKRNLWG
ncbi:hypothetical protein GC173_16030 [bacterium]|nr:hypothetical protein [bacterium]